VIAVSDEDRATVEPFLAKNRYSFAVALDPGRKVNTAFSVREIPKSFIFDREGRLLYYFGQKGSGFGEFQLPTGLFIDRNDKMYVVDSFNRRVQIFKYFAQGNNESR